MRLFCALKLEKVHIIPVNDEKPVMIRNDKLQVQIGESRFISGRYLHATDLDTSDDQILFIVKSLPTEGELILNQFGKDDKILRKDESFTEDQGKIILQSDLRYKRPTLQRG